MGLVARWQRLRERFAQLEATTQRTHKAIAPLDGRLSRLQEQLNAQQDALTALARQLDRLDKAMADMRGDLRNVDAKGAERSAELTSTTGEVVRRLSNLEVHVKRQRRRITNELQKLQTRLKKLRNPFDAPRETRFIDAARPLVEGRRTLLGYDRLYVLWQAARNVAPLGLAAAEIGVFRGGSSYLLAQTLATFGAGPVELHAVDTFAGHLDRQITTRDTEQQRGKFTETDVDDVRAFLGQLAGVTVHQGNARDVIEAWPERRYGLVHIDVDLYEPTRDCLTYFAARVAAGGVIVLDDYGAPSCPGVAQAAADVLAGRTEYHRWDTQTEQLVLTRR